MNIHRRAFECWAPSRSPWSDWAKPALFATAPPVGHDLSALELTGDEMQRLPNAAQRTAIIVDLPGLDSIRAGLALARRGYRPVPLYNTTYGPMAAVDVRPIAQLLMATAEEIEQLSIEPHAPPAFLLDSNRLPSGLPPGEGVFDNRWIVFPQDFPSAVFLKTHEIDKALLLQNGREVREDLAHVLLRWQEAGVEIQLASLTAGEGIRPLQVKKPPLYRRAWYRLVAILGLRRNNVGGFGAVVPIASAG
jgi:hypothetical protein